MKEKNFLPQVDSNLCKACGYCMMQCPKGLFISSKKINSHGYEFMTIDEEKQCIGCLKCIATCPDFAITVISL
mgnify:FL=1